jgi:8-hydroxy-5-deazaflavin:NADPH oxidoreductase
MAVRRLERDSGKIRHMAATQNSPEVDPAQADRPDLSRLVIGVLGGTGNEGRGLACRFATAGLKVIIGSRQAARAATTAEELTSLAARAADAARAAGPDGAADGASTTAAAGPAGAARQITGLANPEAAAASDLVIVAVPWEGHSDLLRSLAETLAGKIVIDCVNPLGFDSHGAYSLPVPEGSAAQQAAAVLPGSRVVGAFHHVSSALLLDPEVTSLDQDILVLGDDRAATSLVQELAGVLPGVRGVYAGRLRNCGQVEALTANLVSVNRRYKAHAGLRVTDI